MASIVRVLVEEFQVDVPQLSYEGVSPLHAACARRGNIDVIRLLVQHGAPVQNLTPGRTIPSSMLLRSEIWR